MNTEAEINLLRDRVRELERTIEKLERFPAGGLPWWRRASVALLTPLLTFGTVFGLAAYYRLSTGDGPVFFETHQLESYSVQTVQLDFQDPEDSDQYWGKIEGRSSSIYLRSKEGEVRIDPRGIRIEGPNGVLVLEPEEK